MPESAILIPENNYEICTPFLIEIKHNAFHGRFNECPLQHITNFTDMCPTLAEGTTLEYVMMKAFRWSLAGPALKWLEGLRPRSLTTWAEVG